jgi:hypothetical protein
MFNSGMKEAQENAVTYPDLDPNAFGLFVEWLYTGKFKCINFGPNDAECTKFVQTHIHLYGFAEMICEPTIKDDVMIATAIRMFGRNNHVPTQETLSLAYAVCPTDSTMCRFMADLICYLMSSVAARNADLVKTVQHVQKALSSNATLMSSFLLRLHLNQKEGHKPTHPSLVVGKYLTTKKLKGFVLQHKTVSYPEMLSLLEVEETAEINDRVDAMEEED